MCQRVALSCHTHLRPCAQRRPQAHHCHRTHRTHRVCRTHQTAPTHCTLLRPHCALGAAPSRLRAHHESVADAHSASAAAMKEDSARKEDSFAAATAPTGAPPAARPAPPAGRRVRLMCTSCKTLCEVMIPAAAATPKQVRYQVRCPNCKAVNDPSALQPEANCDAKRKVQPSAREYADLTKRKIISLAVHDTPRSRPLPSRPQQHLRRSPLDCRAGTGTGAVPARGEATECRAG